MRLNEEQRQLAEGVVDIVFRAARLTARRYPGYAEGELVYFGWRGLCRAARKYAEGGPASFRTFATWVVEMAIRVAIRRERAASRLEINTDQWFNFVSPESGEADARLDARELMGRLYAKDHDLAWLHYWDGLAQHEIASRHGVCESVVSYRIAAMIGRCRKIWSVEPPASPKCTRRFVTPREPCVDCTDRKGATRPGSTTAKRTKGRCQGCHNRFMRASKQQAKKAAAQTA